jgi:hypothetical protein
MNKLCKTKPIPQKPKMNLTPYITESYGNKPEISAMEKQSQTNPISGRLYSSIFIPAKTVVSGDYPENTAGFFTVKPRKTGCNYVQ